jgi:hypothetical protein
MRPIDVRPLASSLDFEIFRRGLASVRDLLVLDDLTLIQTGQTGPFDGRDVNENIFPTAALRLNEPVSFLRLNHFTVPRAIEGLQIRGACIAYGSSEIHIGSRAWGIMGTVRSVPETLLQRARHCPP